MGKKKIQKNAEKQGLTQLPLTVLYARPRTILPGMSGFDDALLFLEAGLFKTNTPDIPVFLLRYIKNELKDSSVQYKRSRNGRHYKNYILAPNSKLYLEIFTKIVGILALRTSNYVTEINIYCDDQQILQDIAKVVNEIYNDGMLAHMKWDKVEKKFKFNREDCIDTWIPLLECT